MSRDKHVPERAYLCLQLVSVDTHVSRPGPLVPAEDSDGKPVALLGVCSEAHKGHGDVLVEEGLGVIVVGDDEDAAAEEEGGGEVVAARGRRGGGETAEGEGVWAGERGPEGGEGQRAGHGGDWAMAENAMSVVVVVVQVPRKFHVTR